MCEVFVSDELNSSVTADHIQSQIHCLGQLLFWLTVRLGSFEGAFGYASKKWDSGSKMDVSLGFSVSAGASKIVLLTPKTSSP